MAGLPLPGVRLGFFDGEATPAHWYTAAVKMLSVSEVEWLGVIVDHGLKAQPDAHHVRRARDATMAVVDEPYGATDFRRSGESFECDEGAAIVHDPLRQLDLACTTRESAAGAQVVERAIPRDGRIETEI